MKSHGSINRVYRLIWSQVLNGWVAVAESARGRGKGASRKLIAAALSLTATFAQAGPVGGQVVSGTGSVTQSGATTTIQQASQNLSLNWQSFNIAPQETVNFVQPSASAIAVNRIFDTSGTKILGQLNANGQVYLINPNGILFGQGAQVNVGGLVASTLDFNDASLNGTTRSFSGNGTGSIVNQGTINATGSGGTGGYVALLGNTVSNQGTITAQRGSVALGAGSAATLTFQNNSLVKMQVDQSVLNSLAENGGLIRADGGMVVMNAGAKDTLLASVVNNTGVIEARTVENHEGSIILLGGMAAGTTYVSGTLDASAPNGGNGGFIETSAAHVNIADNAKITTLANNGKTGTWLIDPTNFTIAAGSGAPTTSGIGATTLSNNLGSTSVIIATAAAGAEAGDIFVNSAVTWAANKLTLSAHNNININANLSASGSASLALIYGQSAVAAGNTSNYIIAPNVQVDLPAGTINFTTLQGSDGAVKNFTVITSLGAASSTTAADLQGMNGNVGINYVLGSNIDATATSGWNAGAGFVPVGNVTTKFTGIFDGLGHTISNLIINRSTTNNVGLFGHTGTGSIIRNVGLVNGSVRGLNSVGGLVGNNDGTVSNSYARGNVSGLGNYAGGLVGWNSGTVNYSYAIGNVTGEIGSGGGSYVGGLAGENSGAVSNSYVWNSVVAGAEHIGGLVGRQSDPGTVINSHYDIDTVTIKGGTYVTLGGLYNVGGTGQFNDWLTNNLTLNIANYASLSPVGANSYTIGSVQGMKDLLGFAENPAYTFRLATNIDLAAAPSLYIPYLAGIFDGAGFTISNLTVNLPIRDNVGLIGYAATGSVIRNVSLVGGSVSGNGYVGGLVGRNFGAVSNSDASVNVSGVIGGSRASSHVGGLVGRNAGTVSDSHATGNVSGEGVMVGGLVGSNSGTVNNSYAATGSVSGFTHVGGLVGYNDGAVSNSYATGSVSGINSEGGINGVGGLVGTSYGMVSNSYATGSVIGGSGSSSIGGLVGYSDNDGGVVDNSYATGSVSGTYGVGGLVGDNSGGTVNNSYAATGSVSGTSNVGGLVGSNDDGGSVDSSYATGSVSGTSNVGGLVGNNALGTTVSNAYATGPVSGTGTKGGLVGNNVGTVSNSFWDTQASGQSAGMGAGTTTGVTGRTTAEMMSMATFSNAGWDIANTGGSGLTWRIYEGSTTPWLTWWLKPVTVTLNSDTQTYSGAPYSDGNGYAVGNPAPSLSGTVGSPNPALLGTLAYGGDSQSAVNAGSYTIGASGLYSVQQGYDISYVNGNLTITKAPATVTANSDTKTYTGVSQSVSGFTASGLVPGETASVLSGVTAGGSGTNAGSYTATAGVGSYSGNYTLSFVDGNLTINKAHLTVTADNKTRLYGAANPALSTTVSGFVNGETAGTAAGFTGAGSATTTAGATTNVGTAVISAGAGNLAATNYAFTNLVDGTLTINPAAPTVNPNAPPINFASPPAPVLNALAQLQSEALFYRMNNEPQTLNLSPTLTVTHSVGTGSAASSSESVNPAAGSTRMNVNTLMNVNTIVMGPSLQIMNIGATGTTLQIVNGGMRLPDTLANEN